MQPIDVHILHLPTENRKWWVECLESLQNHPINIHHLPGIRGDYWAGRCKGYMTGKAPYVSFVDPDDIVLPGAFAACQATLDQDTTKQLAGVYTCSRKLYKDRATHTSLPCIRPHTWTRELMEHKFCVHQISVMRREFVEQCISSYYYPDMHPLLESVGGRGRYDQFFFKMMTLYGDFKNLPIDGYIWRHHSNNSHKISHTIRERELTPYTKDLIHNIVIKKQFIT